MNTPYIAQQTVNDFGQRFSTIKYSANIAATTDTTLTVPSSAPRYKVIIKVSAAGVLWVANNAVAASPAGAAFASTTSELVTDARSLCREVIAGDVLHFYSTAIAGVSVVFYALNTTNGI